MSAWRWRLVPGRSLRWGPAWDEADARLVFDACSGDHWVLSWQAAALLQGVEPGRIYAADELCAVVPRDDDMDAPALEHAVLLPLARAGVLQALRDGRPLPRVQIGA